ncbi:MULTISPECIES: helix-turn-helix domain-containing protein [unclassified Mesorhizobium]|uniref:helix-turn-helix domain-containing protein n=1 Tax=unclassified Mesorhizobium TaxID=325217 RepID=UPI001926C11D|nr:MULTISPECIES: helix-turn-helix transcriptional regulator [unclassified Mesorhizobium]BCH04710.1 hypothetical protein MesoLj131b_67090 [Mesorhizobium sp. 131-2-5]BCH12058.1 hypothetical protein MesoLj131c_63160 [Mesorhizobium sp. 131-3-5]
MVTPQQIRSARTLLGWTQKELSEAAGVSVTCVANLDRGATTGPHGRTVSALQQALEAGGVEFIGETTIIGRGVRLRT